MQILYFSKTLILPISVVAFIMIIYLGIKYSANYFNKFQLINSNILLEIIWMLIPIGILSQIGLVSRKNFQIIEKSSYIIVKITAHQWYWNYKYIIKNKFCFNSKILELDQRSKFNKSNIKIYPELLVTDYELVIPAKKNVKLLVTSADVNHSFTVPSFDIKIDAIPGKINTACLKVDKPGIYYGQCSEFCGKNHAFMPIAIRVVSKKMFKEWIKIASVINIDDAFNILKKI